MSYIDTYQTVFRVTHDMWTFYSSGKTTLLHAIAGKVKEDKKISLYGKRYINNLQFSGDSQLPSAFIEQEVKFFPHMTVKETLDFQVELKMGSVLKTQEARDKRVSELMDQLGLNKSANTIVGNAKVRGLSGGERKRLSIACEMISSPALIFLDEPTLYEPAISRAFSRAFKKFVYLRPDPHLAVT